jgi:two-component system sensor histidine kinase VicK
LTLNTTHQITYEPCKEVLITADREKIGQVLLNLIGNAIKYSPDGTTIIVRCEMKKEHVEFSVIDQGYGISAADQSRLFERFYRVNDERKYRVSGFGIGLYLVSEILKLHGGEVKVQSDLGLGSKFSFALPFQ